MGRVDLAMLLILPYLVLWTLSLEGLGRLVLLSCAAREGADDPLLGSALSGFVGLGTLCVAGATLNLLLPLGAAAACAAFAAGLLGLRLAPPRWTRESLGLRAAVLVIAAVAASKDVRHYDTGLYHLPTVLWEQAQALPLGLANLHPRFGFNTLWDAGIPMLALPGVRDDATILAAPLVLGFWGTAIAASALTLWRERPSLRAWFVTATIVPWYYAAIDIVLPSASNDLPLEALTLLVIAALLGTSRAVAEDRSPGVEVAAGLAAIVAVAVKLSGVPLAVTVLGVLVLRERSIRHPPVARVLAAGAIVAAVMLLRGLLLSGCVVFPAASTCVAALPWTVPAATARAAAAGIREWARLAGRPAPPGELAWVAPWLERNAADPQLRTWAAVATAGVALALVAAFRRRLDARSIRAPAFAAMSLVVFGLATAPDPRFFLGGLFALALLPLAVGADALAETSLSARSFASLAPALVAMTIAVHAVKPLHWIAWPPFPSVAARTRDVDGTTLRVAPAGSDQCWATAPPCAPDDDLAIRIDRSADGRIREIRSRTR